MIENLFRIAVCDDEEIFRNQIGSMTKTILKEAGISYQLSFYKDGTELFQDLKKGEKFQILLLDVIMDEMDGMKLAEEIRKDDEQTGIIFISSDREMVFRGYEVRAARYLAKPLKEEKLKEALLYCIAQQQVNRDLLLPTEYGHHKIAPSDIQYIEAYERGTRFVLLDETIDAKMKFGEVEKLLPDKGFVQSHRAYIVNLIHVKRIRTNEFELTSGIKVPISKYRYQDVSRKFFDFMK